MKGAFLGLFRYVLVYLTESVRQIICPRWDQFLMHLPYWCQWKHNAYVMATVPKENLLVWNLKEGWEPLCKFLNKPIPSDPIPHDNRTGDKEFMERYILNKPIFKEVWIRNHICLFYITNNHFKAGTTFVRKITLDFIKIGLIGYVGYRTYTTNGDWLYSKMSYISESFSKTFSK